MTSVEVWAPAFARVLKEPLAVGDVFSAAEDRHFPGQRWCRLCETHVRAGKELERHAKEHQRELDRWRKGGRRAAEKANADRLRAINRERALEKKVLGQAPGDGSGPSSGGRHEPTKTKEAPRMATTTSKTAGRIKPLSDAKEKKVISDVEKAFANESDDFKKGAIVYGRKLMKLSDGLRASRPPVPPALIGSDREKTRATCASVAKAIGLDPAKVGLGSAATPAEALAGATAEKVEEQKKSKATGSKKKSGAKSAAKKNGSGSKKKATPKAAVAKS